MPRTSRSIGSDGLEQGGMDLGNDISRKDHSVRNAGDALTDPPIMSGNNNTSGKQDDELDDDALLADDEMDIDEDDDLLIDDEDDIDEDDKNI